MNKTFGMLSVPGTFVGAGGRVEAGRRVANTELLRALIRHGSFDRFCFFIGENGDRAEIDALCTGPAALPPERLQVRHLLDLPRAFSHGELSVVHHPSHVERFLDLIWLRDRYLPLSAPAAIPVTGQIHSLSYPDLMPGYLRMLMHPPGAADAIFCSTQAGRLVLQRSLDDARAALARMGAATSPLGCALPVVPLGVDVDRLRTGDRAATRARLGLAADDVVLLGLGRFSEYDKMDLFPLLQVFQRVVQRRTPDQPRLRLLLAGARQGTQTPKMVSLWAQALGVGEQVVLHVDFPEEEKPDLLAAADLFVSPCDNLQETFGISVIEALAAGLPAVVSDFDGYKESVTPEVGVRIPTRWNPDLARLSEMGPILYARPLHLLLGQNVEVDLQAFEDTLVDLCADQPRRARLSEQATLRARTVYDWSVVVRGYEAIWADLSSQPPIAKTPTNPAPHPAALDFGRVFAHYPTDVIDADRRVRRSALSRSVGPGGNGYFIYPEVRHVFGGDDVSAALDSAEGATTVGQVTRAASARFSDGERWRAGFLIAWLLKHGLLENVQ